MATYTVWLGNPTGMVYHWKDLCFAVQALFKPALEGNPKFDKVQVRSTMSAPTLGPSSILIYALPSQLETLVGPLFHTAPGPDGLTGWKSASKETASEVYFNSKAVREVARLVFHEALHNTLHLSDAALHQQGGMAGSPVGQTQTKNDVALMKRGMQHAYPQWVGGFEASHDPLNGL